MLFLPSPEFTSFTKIVSAIPGVNCTNGTLYMPFWNPSLYPYPELCRPASLTCTQLIPLLPSLTLNLDGDAFTIPAAGLCIEVNGEAVVPI